MDWLVVAIIVAAVLLLLLICWRRVPADKAMVITGLRKRVLVGRGGFVIPILETSCLISLEAVSMTTDITEAPSKQGIFVDIAGTAVVKVDNSHDAVLTAVESRSSSPVRIPRDETYQSAVRGLYPCGEGAGYAGGILSAAADGMRCAEHICQSISQEG